MHIYMYIYHTAQSKSTDDSAVIARLKVTTENSATRTWKLEIFPNAHANNSNLWKGTGANSLSFICYPKKRDLDLNFVVSLVKWEHILVPLINHLLRKASCHITLKDTYKDSFKKLIQVSLSQGQEMLGKGYIYNISGRRNSNFFILWKTWLSRIKNMKK